MAVTARSVLITRPEPGASETAGRVAQLGFVPIISPALRVRPLAAQLPPAATLAAVVVASSNALAALPHAHRMVPLLAVGNATAERARAAGFAEVSSADGDSAALAKLVSRNINPKAGPLLLVTGRGQGGQLAANLRQAGYRVTRRVVYTAEPESALSVAAITALQTRQVRAVLFFSAETARHFVQQIRRAGLGHTLAEADAISIGQPAAMALQQEHWRRIRVAARPTQDEMLVLLHD